MRSPGLIIMNSLLAALLLTDPALPNPIPWQEAPPQEEGQEVSADVLQHAYEQAQESQATVPDKPFDDEDVTTFLDGSRRIRNRLYTDGTIRDWYRHLLDVYLPAEENWADGRPMIMWIHGGGWQIGYKDDLLGLYGYIARQFADRGIAFVNINYRLSPRVQHPGHVEDCAAAFAWLKQHADDFGYDPAHMFVSGHSAGAHLAALLCTDAQWLDPHDLSPADDVAGCIPSSGIYDLARLNTMIAFEDGEAGSAVRGGRLRLGRGWVNPFRDEDLANASPTTQVRADTPPFLVIHEETSFGNYMEREARALGAALTDSGVEHEIVEIPNENHVSMLIDMLRPDNLAVDRILAFMAQCMEADDPDNMEP
ncbi:MAG: alpha/beta hydrolase [Planctomycetes bacterium]|nr:alpha/beta hydrolase [Planctomycetota bacterium]NOG53008.1 alpha/beta hydrolase [Planctomycetota bacterium]